MSLQPRRRARKVGAAAKIRRNQPRQALIPAAAHAPESDLAGASHDQLLLPTKPASWSQAPAHAMEAMFAEFDPRRICDRHGVCLCR